MQCPSSASLAIAAVGISTEKNDKHEAEDNYIQMLSITID